LLLFILYKYNCNTVSLIIMLYTCVNTEISKVKYKVKIKSFSIEKMSFSIILWDIAISIVSE